MSGAADGPFHGEGHPEMNTDTGRAERQKTCSETSPKPLDPAMPEAETPQDLKDNWAHDILCLLHPL